VRGPGAEVCIGSSGTVDPRGADWRGPDPTVAEDPVDPTTGESSTIGDPVEGDVAVAEEGVVAENPGRSPVGADDAEGLSPPGAGDPVGARVPAGEAKPSAEDLGKSGGVGGDQDDVADADSVPPVGRGDRGGTAADTVVVGG
jgi:hypothetical protein